MKWSVLVRTATSSQDVRYDATLVLALRSACFSLFLVPSNENAEQLNFFPSFACLLDKLRRPSLFFSSVRPRVLPDLAPRLLPSSNPRSCTPSVHLLIEAWAT
jgi:hypothetical protein